VLNLSKSKTKLNSIISMKTINGHDVPSKAEVKNKIDAIERVVAKTAGISAVKTTTDFDNYITTITCNFTNVSKLNDAIKNVYNSEHGKIQGVEKTYDYNASTGVFSRVNKFSLKDDYKKMSNADKEIFATANYTAIYKFEGSVTAASAPDTKIAASKKAAMLKLNALDIVTGKKSVENKINLTKQ
jgi:outer membrane receptor for ferrienterochelin and colicin